MQGDHHLGLQSSGNTYIIALKIEGAESCVAGLFFSALTSQTNVTQGQFRVVLMFVNPTSAIILFRTLYAINPAYVWEHSTL